MGFCYVKIVLYNITIVGWYVMPCDVTIQHYGAIVITMHLVMRWHTWSTILSLVDILVSMVQSYHNRALCYHNANATVTQWSLELDRLW